MIAIQTSKLTKRYGDLTAVDGIDLEIAEGELFGFLGPNGAGKTTTISMLSTILKPTGGTARVWGNDIQHSQDAVRRSIGVVFQDPSLDDNLTGTENLQFHGRLYKVPRDKLDLRMAELMELMELSDRADDLVKTYSGGMRRRLEIARGLLHYPRVLFLDEPTLGLDPQTRRLIWTYIEKLNAQENVTMLMTTHYMEEADYLCDRVAIIDHGRIVALDAPSKLKDDFGGDIVTISLGSSIKKSGDRSNLKSELTELERVTNVEFANDTLTLTASQGETVIPPALNVLRTNRIEVRSVSLHEPTLEDVFIKYTGRVLRDEGERKKGNMKREMQQSWRFRH